MTNTTPADRVGEGQVLLTPHVGAHTGHDAPGSEDVAVAVAGGGAGDDHLPAATAA
jgi:hypothetical protein